MSKRINLIAEMVLGMLSADGRLSRAELRTLKRIAPQYIKHIDRDFFDRVINGFNGNPEFGNCAQALSDQLSEEEKIHYHDFFKELAESDDLDQKEEDLLNQLNQIWGLQN